MNKIILTILFLTTALFVAGSVFAQEENIIRQYEFSDLLSTGVVSDFETENVTQRAAQSKDIASIFQSSVDLVKYNCTDGLVSFAVWAAEGTPPFTVTSANGNVYGCVPAQN